MRGRERFLLWLALAACLIGTASAVLNMWSGIALSHDDAKARLVVARRLIDNRTPGLLQIGGIWLPFPQVVNALPAQSDGLFDSGAVAIALSVAGYVLAVAGLGGLMRETTGSTAAALTAAVLLGANPNLIYLAGTPLVEPLAAGTLCAGLFALVRASGAPVSRPLLGSAAFVLLGAACLTRYEAWAVGVVASLVLARQGANRIIAAIPLAAVILGVTAGATLNYLSTGQWFVTDGFFAPVDTSARGDFAQATWQVARTLVAVLGPGAAVVVALGAIFALAGYRRRKDTPLLALALWAAAAPSILMYEKGHPVHLRFAVSLLPAAAAMAAVGVAALPQAWRSRIAALVLVAFLPGAIAAPRSGVAWEARANRERDAARSVAASCIASEVSQGDEPILASMTQVAPFMHVLRSEAGVPLRRYVHEGNDERWRRALDNPAATVRWVLFADTDRLGIRWWQDPLFAPSFTVTCRGGGVTLLSRLSPSPAGP